MPPDACSTLYNTAFASALITAKMLGQKSFVFNGTKVKVADHINGVVSDLSRGKFTVVCRTTGNNSKESFISKR